MERSSLTPFARSLYALCAEIRLLDEKWKRREWCRHGGCYFSLIHEFRRFRPICGEIAV